MSDPITFSPLPGGPAPAGESLIGSGFRASFAAGNRICQGIWVTAFGLGLASFAHPEPGNLALLGMAVWVFHGRLSRGDHRWALPDPLAVGLPFLWAANATAVFLPWWEWLRWGFLAALGLGVTDLWQRARGRRSWSRAGFGWALPAALAAVVLLASALRATFPLFTSALYLNVLHACVVFFGGLLISQAAWPVAGGLERG